MTATVAAPRSPTRPVQHPLLVEAAGVGAALAVALVAVAHLCLTPRAWVLFSDADSVLLPMMRGSVTAGEPQRPQSFPAVTGLDQSLTDTLDEYEKILIARAISVAEGNIAEAARRLKTDRPNLYRRMKRLGIPVGGE